MYEKVFAYLDAHAEDYAAQLCRWVEVPSVKGEATPDAPFGKDVRRMLDVAMADAKAFGYETRDFDGYACDITLPGESEEAIAVLGHLDVVPAGDNWATPPFTATRVGDQIFARGTSDDKGPALAALYAMNAIKAAGIPLKKSIRLILGCDEESGWEDMAYYCAHTEMPEVGFSPDASFPIINTEKGMIHGFFTSKLAEDGLQVKQLWTGERVNVIPGESKALIAGGQEVADKVAAYAEKTGLPYTAEVTADGVWVTAEGIPGHSAYPEGRRNAIGMMLVLLREMGVTVVEGGDSVLVRSNGRLRHTNVKTQPYPGFPTDMQPQIAVCMSLASGVSVITESIYDTRFGYCAELNRMGASIKVDTKVAIITGVEKLHGCTVRACDLRAGAAMVIAGLAADRTTTIEDIEYIERGYENLIGKLTAIGAEIRRVSVPDGTAVPAAV